MKHDVGMEILNELGKAEITVKASQSKKPQNLLELIDNDDLDVIFNGYRSLAMYKDALLKLFNQLKAELADLVINCKKSFLECAKEIRSKLTELNILLNPKDEEVLLAHIEFNRHPRFVTEEYHLDIIKKKL